MVITLGYALLTRPESALNHATSSYRQTLGTIKMKPGIAILIILLNSKLISAQELSGAPKGDYEVSLLIKFECDGSIRKIDYFTLSNNGKTYYAENGMCYVPDKGIYIAEAFGIDNLEVNQIYVQKQLQIDTILVHKIYIERSTGLPGWPYYSYCGKPCDGLVSDTWENGNLRINGKFKNGKIKYLYHYNRAGQLHLIQKNSKFRSLHKAYDQEKLIVKLYRVLIFGFAKVWNPETTKYYRDEYYHFKN